MLSESEIDKLTHEVVAGAEEEFVAQLTAALVDDYVHGVEKGASSRWRMEELARANREHVETILRQFQNTAISEAANLVLAALMAADERSARMIANHQGREVRAATRQSVLMAKQTARGVGEIVRRQNIDLAAQAERRWYEVTAQTLALSNRGALPRGYYERAIMELGRAGVSKVNYRSGVSNQIDVAIKRHIRTQVNQAAGRMEIERLNDTGHNLVITSAHFGARPEHAVWQGKAFSMSGRQVVNGVVYEDFYQQTGYGTVTGLCGANCRHHFGVYIPGMALPELPKKINGMDSDEYYATTQRQRELERRVRKTKRDISALEQAGVGLDSQTYVQKRLVLGNQQKQLRQLCADKGLKREPYREKAYGIGKQPVALRSKGKPKASVAAAPQSNKPKANAAKRQTTSNNKALDIDAKNKQDVMTEEMRDYFKKEITKPEGLWFYQNETLLSTFGELTCARLAYLADKAIKNKSETAKNIVKILTKPSDKKVIFEIKDDIEACCFSPSTGAIMLEANKIISEDIIVHEWLHRQDFYLSIVYGKHNNKRIGSAFYNSQAFTYNGKNIAQGLKDDIEELEKLAKVEGQNLHDYIKSILENNGLESGNATRLSDILDAGTNGAVKFSSGHSFYGNDYWSCEEIISRECLADYGSSCIINTKEAALIKKCFPNMTNVLDKLIKVMAND